MDRSTRKARDAVKQPGAAGGGKVSKPGRIRSGWMLAKLSWRVLMLDKELLVFPLLSGISCLLVISGFAGGIWASGMGQQENVGNDAATWAVVFAWYFVNYFVIVFFNSALVACAIIRFRGGDPTVGDGLRAAGERIAQIAAWALLASSVGVILRMIESRVELVGRIMAALLGAAWTIAAYLVVPVLVVEKLGPIDAFKRSTMIISKTWGESIVSNVGIGLVTFLVAFLLLGATGIALSVLAAQMQSLAVVLAGLAVMLLLFLLIWLVSSALNSIVLSAIYLYATEDKMPEAFQGSGMQEAFVRR